MGIQNLAKAKVKGSTFQVINVPVKSRSIYTPLGSAVKVTPKVPKLGK